MANFKQVYNCLSISTYLSIYDTISAYDTNLKSVVDDHTALQTKHEQIKRNTRWINDKIRSAKVVRRRFERTMKKSGSDSFFFRFYFIFGIFIYRTFTFIQTGDKDNTERKHDNTKRF